MNHVGMKSKNEAAPVLLRLSEVAEMVGMHPKTVYHWVRSGRLSAVASPGGMLRVRAEDARALCRKSGLQVPEKIATVPRKLVIVGDGKGATRTLGRSLKGKGFDVSTYASVYEAFVAIVKDPPEVLVIDPEMEEIDVAAMLSAFKSDDRTKQTKVFGWGNRQEDPIFAGSAPYGDTVKMSALIH